MTTQQPQQQIIIDISNLTRGRVKWIETTDEETISFLINIDTPIRPFSNERYDPHSIDFVLNSSCFMRDEYIKIKVNKEDFDNSENKTHFIMKAFEAEMKGTIWADMSKTTWSHGANISFYRYDDVRQVFRDRRINELLNFFDGMVELVREQSVDGAGMIARVN
jgi:hypothetical protein